MWAGMDMVMAATGAQLAGMASNPTGVLATQLPALAGASWASIGFSDGDRNTGAAKATGYSAKLGGVYKASKDVSIGGSYQFKSHLGDMKTAAGAATMAGQGGFADTGTLTVIDFQWPSVIAVGASWQASPALMVAADLKSIGWADTMKSFRMRYESTGMGGSVDFAMPQNWKDQTVLSLGVAWKAGEQLTLRAGVNLADNPIPEDLVNPLFPATVKSHITAGFGYQMTQNGAINMSLTIAPKVSVTNSSGVTTTHEQTNVQLMYSHRF
jgi:long-chain fatty acid transport protein